MNFYGDYSIFTISWLDKRDSTRCILFVLCCLFFSYGLWIIARLKLIDILRWSNLEQSLQPQNNPSCTPSNTHLKSLTDKKQIKAEAPTFRSIHPSHPTATISPPLKTNLHLHHHHHHQQSPLLLLYNPNQNYTPPPQTPLSSAHIRHGHNRRRFHIHRHPPPGGTFRVGSDPGQVRVRGQEIPSQESCIKDNSRSPIVVSRSQSAGISRWDPHRRLRVRPVWVGQTRWVLAVRLWLAWSEPGQELGRRYHRNQDGGQWREVHALPAVQRGFWIAEVQRMRAHPWQVGHARYSRRLDCRVAHRCHLARCWKGKDIQNYIVE